MIDIEIGSTVCTSEFSSFHKSLPAECQGSKFKSKVG